MKELWYDYNDVKQAENTYSQLVTLIQGVTDNPTRDQKQSMNLAGSKHIVKFEESWREVNGDETRLL